MSKMFKKKQPTSTLEMTGFGVGGWVKPKKAPAPAKQTSALMEYLADLEERVTEELCKTAKRIAIHGLHLKPISATVADGYAAALAFEETERQIVPVTVECEGNKQVTLTLVVDVNGVKKGKPTTLREWGIDPLHK
jgi:signal recognition particle GTPase